MKMSTIGTTGTLLVAMAAGHADAQSASADHYTHEQLTKIAQELKVKAESAGGSAGQPLAKYPKHFTVLSYREKDGSAEIHEKFADVFFIVDGHATLVTGGTLVDAKSTAPGEFQGTSIKDGNKQELSKGDVVHIPANVPHQLFIPKGSTFTSFVLKVEQEKP